jgi:hypothetical protein
MAEYWQPGAAGYFGRVSKQQTLDAVAEGVTREAAENLAKLKKDELEQRDLLWFPGHSEGTAAAVPE